MSLHPADVIAVLLETSIRISLVAIIVGLVLVALRVRAGAVCHAAWTAVVVTMLLLPVMPKWLPAIPVWMPERPVAARAADPLPVPTAAQKVSSRVAAATTQTAPIPEAAVPVSRAVAAPASPALPWSLAMVLIWIVVSFAMLTRLGVGWRRATRLAADAAPLSEAPSLFESDLVATPVTVGVLFPRVILPTGWTKWPVETREAVLLHEREHIRRRDTLINVLASVNRSVFWFHPLAWWLERRLAVAAEQACDDAVVRASGQSERYANLLVTMADAVRARGARVEWQGVGMAGGGSLDARIDRVLGGAATLATGRGRKIAVALTCAAAITLAVACQRTVPPLRPNPEIADRLAKQKAEVDKYEAARSMAMEQVAAAEATVAKNPEDLETTEKLLVFYQQSGQRSMGWNEMVAARRPHLLRMIEHHPESELASWPFRQSLDAAGYGQARALWMKHVGKPDVTSKTLGAAARFFSYSEKEVAEQLLVRAKALDPIGPQPRVANGMYNSPWSARLGNLYASAIVDADAEILGDRSRSTSPADPNQLFAAEARKKLAASTDPWLLASAGSALTNNVRDNFGRSMTPSRSRVAADQQALGESCLDRSVALDPDSELTKQLIAVRQSMAREMELALKRRAVMDGHGKVDDAKVAALPDADRLEMLPMLAINAYMGAESEEWTHRETYKASFAKVKQLADDALALTEKFKTSPQYGPAAYSAHVTRGLMALRDGDRRLAVEHMREATAALRAGDVLDSWDQMGQYRLCNYLLTAGERESVAEFYEKSAAFARPNGPSLVKAAKAIRAGLMPEGYQYSVTPH
jgi:beta-lactamase regulating signal transducer with metallopeptidase domain